MRLLSWNVNGIRSFIAQCSNSQEDSWIDSLDADILCLQEFKLARARIDRSLAIINHYESYHSCAKKRPGYSGVSIYAKDPYRPLDVHDMLFTDNMMLNEQGPFTASDLDSEGRTIIAEFPLFTLFNIYFPNDPSEDRFKYKMAFNQAVQKRIQHEIAQGKQILLVGDLNICFAEIDHCDPKQSCKDNNLESFADHPARKWLYSFFQETGMVDVYRWFHPDQKNAFTCWNTLINARESNYGTRIDYIICTKGLLPWIKSCDIHPDIMGSDHCPVSVEFHKTHPETGQSILSFMSRDEGPVPTLCASNWPEFQQHSGSILRFLKPKSSTVVVNAVSIPHITPQNTRKQKNLLDFFTEKSPPNPISITNESLEETFDFSIPKFNDDHVKDTWKKLMTPKEAPKCYHDEECRAFTVNKSGPNKGRKFYLCPRPVGPGYKDNGKMEDGVQVSKRQRILNEYRCDFFQWANASTKRRLPTS